MTVVQSKEIMRINKIGRGFDRISYYQWAKELDPDGMSNIEEITKTYNEIIMPSRKTAYSAGYDIHSPIDFTLVKGQDVLIKTGIKVYMPSNEFLMIVPRSGLGFKNYFRLANTIGIVDSKGF